VDKCANLYFCQQAYVEVSGRTVARGYVTVTGTDGQASANDKYTYVNSIGAEAVAQAFRDAVAVSDWQGTFPGIYQSMSATGQADGLSQAACQVFSASLQDTILSRQNFSAQVSALRGWQIALIVIGCLLACCCCGLYCWLELSKNRY
jgi:hypothetical protein